MSCISSVSFGRNFLERYLSISWNFPFVFSPLSHFWMCWRSRGVRILVRMILLL